jgi:pimeloyl-ACP methyl ester carboxylesterase
MYAIRKGYADTNAGQVHFRRVDGKGPPVILLHRIPVTSASFEKMLIGMAGRRLAVAFDTPGFGESFQPAGSPSMTDYAGWILAAIERLGIDRFHLCGHHMGAALAAEIALLAPERTLSLVLNGVIYATPHERATIRCEIGCALPVDEDGRYVAKTWSIVKSLYGRFQPALVNAELVGALASPNGRNQAFDAVLKHDFMQAFTKLTCPVKIIQAQDDALTTLFLDRVRAAYPQIPIELLDDAGIAAPEIQPDRFTTGLLGFADAHDRA